MNSDRYRISINKYIVFVIIIVFNIGSMAVANEGSFLEKFKSSKKKDFNLSAAELQIHMLSIADFCAGTTEKASDKIMELTDDPTVKINALRWKMYSIPIIYKTFYYPKPLQAMIDAWTLIIQMKQYFISGDGRKAFGELNIVGFEAATQMESKIIELAILMSRKEDISFPESFVEAWAKDNPIQMPLFVRTSITPFLSSGIGDETIGTFKAVGELTSQIDNITNILTVYGNQIPKQAKWQSELLLSELGTVETINILLSELRAANVALHQVGTTFELLPDLITSERAVLLETVQNERLDTLAYMSNERDAIIKAIQSLIASERNTLLETIKNERLDTLAYMSSERDAIVEAVQDERKEILSFVQRERLAVINDIKLIGSDIFKDANKSINKSIDHFFIRTAQFVGACLVLIMAAGLAGIYIWYRKKNVTSQPVIE